MTISDVGSRSRIAMVKAALKRSLPPGVWSRLGPGYWRVRRLPSNAEWYLSPWGRQSAQALRQLKDKHLGERCFVFGNGPSLGKMDLRPLVNEVTFGLNRIYLLFDRIGFSTTYYVAVNLYVTQQCSGEILRLTMPKFISWRSRRHIRPAPKIAFIRTDSPQLSFSRDMTRSICEGWTVTYVALQLAYYMGFSQVILVGLDHRFETEGKPGALVTLDGDDPNHFDPRYFADGFQWQLPNLHASEIAYKMANEAFVSAGRSVVDATVDGALQVFPKVDFETVVGGLSQVQGRGPLPI